MSMKTKLFAAAAAAALVGASHRGPAPSADDVQQQQHPRVHDQRRYRAPVRHRGRRRHDLDYPTVGNFNDVTMNGTPQLTSAVIAPFTVIDDSGTGAGWSVTLLVPNFTDGGTPANIVPAAGVEMNAPVVAAGNADSPDGRRVVEPERRLHHGEEDRRRRPDRPRPTTAVHRSVPTAPTRWRAWAPTWSRPRS